MNKNEIKIMICTPIYGGIKTEYHISMLETAIAFERANIYLDIQHVIGSYIEDARNEFVNIFLNSSDNPSHLLFIDSDIKWELQDIRDLIEFSDNENHLIVSGIYPEKRLNPQLNLDNLGLSKIMFSLVNDQCDLSKKDPVKVKHIPMGFCLINKIVFEKFKHHYTDFNYIHENELLTLFFSIGSVKENGVNLRYGEDVYFCKLCRDIGIDIWLLPWVNVKHIGELEYTCKLT